MMEKHELENNEALSGSTKLVPGPGQKTASGDVDAYRERREAYFQELLEEPEPPIRHWVVVGVLLIVLFWVVSQTLSPVSVATANCKKPPTVGVNWVRCQLSGREVTDQNLSGAELHSVSAREASFDRTRMKNVKARFADFHSASFVGADLSQADLTGSSLINARLVNTNLRGADLSYVDLRGADLSASDLAGAKLAHAIWVDGSICSSVSVGGCFVTRP